MPFQKGRQKTGGRKKGTPNKLTRETLKSAERLMTSAMPRIESYVVNSPWVEGALEVWKVLIPYILKKPK